MVSATPLQVARCLLGGWGRPWGGLMSMRSTLHLSPGYTCRRSAWGCRCGGHSRGTESDGCPPGPSEPQCLLPGTGVRRELGTPPCAAGAGLGPPRGPGFWGAAWVELQVQPPHFQFGAWALGGGVSAAPAPALASAVLRPCAFPRQAPVGEGRRGSALLSSGTRGVWGVGPDDAQPVSTPLLALGLPASSREASARPRASEVYFRVSSKRRRLPELTVAAA